MCTLINKVGTQHTGARARAHTHTHTPNTHTHQAHTHTHTHTPSLVSLYSYTSFPVTVLGPPPVQPGGMATINMEVMVTQCIPAGVLESQELGADFKHQRDLSLIVHTIHTTKAAI